MARETQDHAPSQRQATNNQANSALTSKHSIEFTAYSDFSCHLKMKRDSVRKLIADGSVKILTEK